jgi:hypothetical protein
MVSWTDFRSLLLTPEIVLGTFFTLRRLFAKLRIKPFERLRRRDSPPMPLGPFYSSHEAMKNRRTRYPDTAQLE